MTWKEIRPAVFFLGRFLAFYIVVSFLYGWMVTTYTPRPDPATVVAAHQATFVMDVFGLPVSNVTHPRKPAERILLNSKPVLSVYEGCNGVNVWIIFMGFLLAFSGLTRQVLLFGLIGTLIIHLVNLTRIVLLFFVSLKYPDALYFVHKYFFTAGIYLVVFAMWYYWITFYGKRAQPIQ